MKCREVGFLSKKKLYDRLTQKWQQSHCKYGEAARTEQNSAKSTTPMPPLSLGRRDVSAGNVTVLWLNETLCHEEQTSPRLIITLDYEH